MRRGLRGLGSGLQAGISGQTSGIAATVNGILTAVDPMQELIDAMQFGTKPDYMWGGNEASGATEIGGSGVDLVDVSTPLHEQSSAQLGDGNFVKFDGTADRLAYTAGSELSPGTGAFTVLHVMNCPTLLAGRWFLGDLSTTGWRLWHTGGLLYFRTDFGGGQACSVPMFSTDEPQSILFRRVVTGNTNEIESLAGSGSITGTTGDLSPVTPNFNVGGISTVSELQEWGLTAVWKGAVAETVLKAHNDNLLAFLGFV